MFLTILCVFFHWNCDYGQVNQINIAAKLNEKICVALFKTAQKHLLIVEC